MGKVRFSISVSIDGYMAGPRQSIEDPLGVGGMQLHAWAFELEAFQRMHGCEGGVVNASTQIVDEHFAGAGAVAVGQNMFGGQPGPWGSGGWRGWWGEDPPFHLPVFVVTHHPRAPLRMGGGTTFHFVTGIEAALEGARGAAQGKDVVLGGGARPHPTVSGGRPRRRDRVSLVPVLLGAGERPFEGLRGAVPRLAQDRVVEAPGVTQLRYRVVL